jgi:phospholipid transport system transporter-binding protein
MVQIKMQPSLSLPTALNTETVTAIWRELRNKLKTSKEMTLDLQGVTDADSAGVALLVAAISDAKANSKTLQIQNIPKLILDIARIGGVDDMICSCENSG